VGKLRHQERSFSPSSEFRQDETEKLGVLTISSKGKEGWRKTLFPLERNTNIDLVRPVKSEVKSGWGRFTDGTSPPKSLF